MTKAEKAELHYKLIGLLVECDNDSDYFARLLYALQIISAELAQFEKDV
jgi:hypothetical protein